MSDHYADATASSNNLEQAKLFTSPLLQARPALFLDRDGVVIEDGHHLCDPDQVRLCPGARELIASAHRHRWPVVVITNQSGISRGLFSWAEVERVNNRMQDLLGAEAPLAAIYANGHGPDAPANSWRKPSPRMVLAASKALNLELELSLLIGDRLSDLQAGAEAGVAGLFHVMSGHGRNARASVQRWHAQATRPVPSLQLLDSLDSFPFGLINQGNSLDQCNQTQQ